MRGCSRTLDTKVLLVNTKFFVTVSKNVNLFVATINVFPGRCSAKHVVDLFQLGVAPACKLGIHFFLFSSI